MTAAFEESKQFKLSTKIDLFDACLNAASRSNFNLKSDNAETGAITARTNLNFWSWTEMVTIKVQTSGLVTVNSKCSFPLQIFDWGKNSRNVKLFFKNLLLEVEEVVEKETT